MSLTVLLLTALTALTALGAAPTPPAQSTPRLEIALPEPGRRSGEPPAVRSVQILSDRRTRDLLHHGFPARLIIPGAPGVHNTKWVASIEVRT